VWLRDTFGIRTFVETGTNEADTAVWAADEFEHVITIEGSESLHQTAVSTFGWRRNIRFVHGDSRRMLPEVLRRLDAPAIFWLDAHWCGMDTYGSGNECPVLDELKALNAWDTPHIVLVDDARLFLAPPPPPHRSDDWPDINAICRAMDGDAPRRYVAVFEDVIVGVPSHARTRFVEFLRAHADRSPPPSQPALPHVGRPWRRLRKILGSILGSASWR